MIEFKLSEVLRDRGITMYQLSKATKVRPNTVSQWVNNEELRAEGKEVKSISVDVLNAFCRELRCTPNDLLHYVED
ncbi:XRE family transcriptional regulator [Paenibacillus oralis]|uniref:XRE family transcriptional regulator n=1 Tax=Paenibacillus oralis TaxID=2490856 RepID=A0A3P3TVQ9_9BACL|nr:helix-turn-helix transcriptional regulator [Paenibacillus oralis]RRJ61776.1 XRE family transcriptional regulator [Paenibacillus oralis]